MTSTRSARDTARLHLSETAFGTSERVLAALDAEVKRLHVYPEHADRRIEALLAQHYEVSEESVIVGNGSDELVMLSVLALLARDEKGLVTDGTFPGYRNCLDLAGRAVNSVPLRDRRVDVTRAASLFGSAHLAFFCNPHNPSGSVFNRQEMQHLLQAASKSGTTLVFDEAYAEFADEATPTALDAVRSGADVVVLRTFSKAYGLAALRIGYAIGSERAIRSLRRAQIAVPFSVNRFAQAAAAAALEDVEFIASVNRRNAAARSWLAGELAARGLVGLPSQTNFIAVLAPHSDWLQRYLKDEHDILVRDAGRFGFPDCLRVSVGHHEDLMRFLGAIDALNQDAGAFRKYGGTHVDGNRSMWHPCEIRALQ